MILSISMRKFRGIAERTLTFGAKKNLVRGPNESGKTTIAHLLAFGFFGVDLHGVKNPDHLISMGEDECEVAIKTEHATFIRRKRRGKPSDVRVVREGYPDLKPNQTELTKLLGMEYNLFASSFRVGHFMALGDTQKKEVISQAWKADRPTLLREILAQSGHPGLEWPARLVRLENPRIDADAVARERQMFQNQLLADQGALAQVRAQLSEAMALPSDSESLKAKEEEMRRLRAEVQLVELYEQDLRRYQTGAARYHEQEVENKRRLAARQKLELELGMLGEAPIIDTADLDAKHSELMTRITKLRPLPMPDTPPTRNKVLEDVCLRCGQRVPENMKKSIADEHDRMLVELNQKQRETADKNGEIMRERDACEVEARQVQSQIQGRRQARVEWDSKSKYLQRALNDQVIVPNVMPQPPEQVTPSVENPKHVLAKLEAEYQAQKLLEGRASNLLARERDLLHAIGSKETQVAELQALQDALKRLPEVEVATTMEKFKLHKAQVAFIEGEVVVSDEQGIPYLSLSDGRRMKVDLEWVKCFKRLVPGAPNFVFIDNADLVDTFEGYWPDDQSTQVFVVQVESDLKQLEVIQW